MYRYMLFTLVAVSFVLSACDQQSGVTGPVTHATPTTDPTTTTLVKKLAGDLTLTAGQMAVVDEMFYLEEDLGTVLSMSQAGMIESVISRNGTVDDSTRHLRHRAVDMAAIMWFNLARKANPDLDTAVIAQIKDLIASNYAERLAAITAGAGDPVALTAALEALHQQLMDAINAALGSEAVAKTQALKDAIDAQRAALRAQMQALRIERVVAAMTRALGLTTDQADNVRALLTTFQNEVENLRTTHAGDPEGFRTALAVLQAQYEADLEALLGTDLYAKWLEYSNGRIGPIGPGHGHGHGHRR